MNSETDNANSSVDNETVEENEDIYAFFNINKNASKEEINQAYRRLSVIYHPDKHSNPALKLKAEKMFNKINKYYNILSDDQKRQLYDLNIVSSLDDLNHLQVIPFLDPLTGQPMAQNQIKAEYERLMEKAERERIMERSNPQGTISLTLDCCDLFRPYARSLTYNQDLLVVSQSEPNRYPEFRRLNIGQSVECPCGSKDRLILSGSLRSENGLGSGVMSVLWRRIMNRSLWSETTLTLGDQTSIGFDIYGTLMNNLRGFGLFTLNFANGSSFPSLNSGFGISKQLDKHLTGVISTGFNLNLENVTDFENIGSTLYVNSALTYDDQMSKKIIGSLRIGAQESHIQLNTLYRFRDENESKLKMVFELGHSFRNLLTCMAQVGYERKISEQNTLGCFCLVHFPQCSMSLKLKLKRANQTFALNFLICDEELYTKAIFYSIILPGAIYNVSKWFYKLYMQKMGQKLHLEGIEKKKLELEARKKEALTTIHLMTTYANRIRENEENVSGLVILEATYGTCDANHDVTIPLQAMVKDSRLILQRSSKASLAGFYDPCPNCDKILKISYKFKENLYEIEIRDEDGLDIPNIRHKINQDDSSRKIDTTSGFVDDSLCDD